jgi:dolichol kinase
MRVRKKGRDFGQIARKVVHLSTVLVVPVDMLFHEFTVAGLGFLFAFYIFIVLMRLNGRSVPGATRLIGWLSRNDEKSSVVGPPAYMFFSLLILIALFPSFIAYVSIIALSVGDTCAALAGTTMKGVKTVRNNTLAGSVGFFIPVFIIFYFLMSPEKAAMLAGAGAVAELLSHRYDNLTVPFVTAAVAALIF